MVHSSQNRPNLNQLPQRGAALMTALADPTRKTIFNMLIEQPSVVKVISADLPISQSAVSQHLKVMKESGLVLEQRQGRTHLYSANPVALDWLSWQFGLLRDDILSENPEDQNDSKCIEYDAVDRVVESWSQQWSGLDSLATGLMMRFCLIGRHLEWLLEKLALSFGLSSSEILILSTLDRIENRSCSLSELAKISFTQLNTAEDRIKPMEERGLIERKQDKSNPDSTLICLTNTGLQLLRKFYAEQKKQTNAPIYNLDMEDQLKLTKQLRPILRSLRDTIKYDISKS